MLQLPKPAEHSNQRSNAVWPVQQYPQQPFQRKPTVDGGPVSSRPSSGYSHVTFDKPAMLEMPANIEGGLISKSYAEVRMVVREVERDVDCLFLNLSKGEPSSLYKLLGSN